MELYLMRHGIAEDPKSGQPDADRKLTAEGRERAVAVVKLARQGGMSPSLLLTSPYVRAVQTAELAASTLDFKGDMVTVPALVPHGSAEEVWDEIRLFADHQAILLTSHQPLLGSLMGFLLQSPALQVEVRKASVTRIDVSPLRGAPRGVLQWLITPRISLA